MTDSADPLVLFMPSGKRGRFPVGTSVLEAARTLGVYVESVCGGRATCGRCQIEVQEGQFAKHGITSSNDHISPVGPKEKRYAEVRTLPEGRRLSCSATVQGVLVVDVPQDAVVNAQVVRKAASDRVIERNPAVHLCYVEVDEPEKHAAPLLDTAADDDGDSFDTMSEDELLRGIESCRDRRGLECDLVDPDRLLVAIQRYACQCQLFEAGKLGALVLLELPVAQSQLAF